MPTIIALDVSLSMTRTIPGNEEGHTYHQLALQGINHFLDYLTNNSKLEFVSLVIYSQLTEVVVDFTRDYESIRQALKRIQQYNVTNVETMLRTVSNILATTWGTHNYCQVIVFTDCGIGLGVTSLKKTIDNLVAETNEHDYTWTVFLKSTKLSFICLGNMNDSYFVQAIKIYQQFLDVSKQNGCLFLPRINAIVSGEDKTDGQRELNWNVAKELIDRMCDINYQQFEAVLNCGEYFRLKCPVYVWPPPMPYKSKDGFGKESMRMISRHFEVCGYLSLSDIGSPVSVSRHLIIPKMDNEKTPKKTEKQVKDGKSEPVLNEFEKLENEIRAFYSKGEGTHSDEEDGKVLTLSDSHKESVCVLLHGALKVENMAALVLLDDNWFGFIYSYADSKKKSNLMLNVLPPGNDVVPWLGDLRLLGTIEDALPGENPSFPVKPDKRSYSQNCVVWIKQAALQSDIQKVLRHAKKLPEKTLHFYKELNRIRKAAISIGFVELIECLASIFEREVSVLPQTASPDCAIQLHHAAAELRKIANCDAKILIAALPTQYNKL